MVCIVPPVSLVAIDRHKAAFSTSLSKKSLSSKPCRFSRAAAALCRTAVKTDDGCLATSSFTVVKR